MRRSGVPWLLLAAALAADPASAQDAGWTGDANLFLGSKTLDEDDWGSLRRQGESGLQFAFGKRSWPVLLSVDLMGSRVRRLATFPGIGLVEASGATSEVNLGARKFWRPRPRTRPFVGGGLSFVRTEMQVISSYGKARDSGRGGGIWLGGGVLWTLGTAFNVGFELKVSGAEAEIAGVDVGAGGAHLGLVLGYHWGSQVSPRSPSWRSGNSEFQR